MTGCATLFASKQDGVVILAPNPAGFGSDLVVTDNGAPAAFSRTDPDVSDGVVLLPAGIAIAVDARVDHEIRMTEGGQVRVIRVGTGVSTGWFLVDLFTTGPIGIVVDWATHAWRHSSPRIIRIESAADVTAHR